MRLQILETLKKKALTEQGNRNKCQTNSLSGKIRVIRDIRSEKVGWKKV